jgi:hypothetical protein
LARGADTGTIVGAYVIFAVLLLVETGSILITPNGGVGIAVGVALPNVVFVSFTGYW